MVIVTDGIDLAKTVFAVHGVESRSDVGEKEVRLRGQSLRDSSR